MEDTWQDFEDPSFQRMARELGILIQKIIKNVSIMQRLAGGSDTDEPLDSSSIRNMEEIQSQNAILSKQAGELLNTLKDILRRFPNRSRALQVERLQCDLKKGLENFKNLQEIVIKKEKQSLAAFEIQQRSNNYPLLDISPSSSPNREETRQALQMEDRTVELEERKAAMLQLESDIVDVNAVFKDLANMVNDQQEIVDSIDDRIMTTEVNVASGGELLKSAHKYQSSARKKKIIIAIFVLIIASVLIGIIVWKSLPSKSGNN